MTVHEHERATRETEEWFLQHGLPFFVEGRRISMDDLAHGRSVVVLALAYFGSLLLAVPADRPWPERLLLAAAGVLALVAVWAVANLARRQRALERPRRVGVVEVAVFALGPAAVVAVLRQDPDLVLGVLLADITVLAVVAAAEVLDAGPIARWAVVRTFAELGSLFRLVTRALPMLLLFITFLFINTEVWQVSSALSRPVLWLAVAFFGALALGFLLARLPEEVAAVNDDLDPDVVRRAVRGTPLEPHLDDLSDVHTEPLDRRQRTNLLLVLLVTQASQVLLLAVSVLAVLPALRQRCDRGQRDQQLGGERGAAPPAGPGRARPLPRAAAGVDLPVRVRRSVLHGLRGHRRQLPGAVLPRDHGRARACGRRPSGLPRPAPRRGLTGVHRVGSMEYRTLGRSGAAVSTFALGTMTFGNETDEEGSHEQLDLFLEAGGTLVDTADVYTAGASEEIVGRWLDDRPSEVTDRVVLATKARFPMGEDRNDAGLSRRHLTRALDASLTRLKVDCVDLYQVHAWDPLTPVEETLGFFDDVVRAGKVRYAGLSNFSGWQVQKTVDLAERLHLPRPVTLQPMYNLLGREIEWEIVPACRENGLGLLPWSPLGRRLADRQVHPRPAAQRRHPARRGPRPRR